jgi:hypothetical protein
MVIATRLLAICEPATVPVPGWPGGFFTVANQRGRQRYFAWRCAAVIVGR